jgi:hypothetical protein
MENTYPEHLQEKVASMNRKPSLCMVEGCTNEATVWCLNCGTEMCPEHSNGNKRCAAGYYPVVNERWVPANPNFNIPEGYWLREVTPVGELCTVGAVEVGDVSPL